MKQGQAGYDAKITKYKQKIDRLKENEGFDVEGKRKELEEFKTKLEIAESLHTQERLNY